jgi:D-alanine-D-alanine ligase
MAAPNVQPGARPAGSERLSALIASGRAAAADTAIFVIANLKDLDGELDITDVQTEFLSETELREIVGGCRDAGFYTDTFTDPGEFCQWAAGHGPRRFPLPNRAVYSIAQPGSSASRHAPLAAVAELFDCTLLTPPAFEACLSHHKAYATLIMKAAGVSTPATWLYDARVGWVGSAPDDGVSVIAKPCLESASIGVDQSARFAFSPKSEGFLRELSRRLGQAIVVQAFIPGREVEVTVVNDGRAFALDPVGIALDGQEHLGDQILDYGTVYRDGYDFYDFAGQEPGLSARLREEAARAAESLGLRGISRFDFRIADNGEAFVMDMTGKPHLTRHSSVAYRFDWDGFAYGDIFATLVGSARAAAGIRPSA